MSKASRPQDTPHLKPPKPWQTWVYTEWNKRLLEYCLGKRGNADDRTVTRLAATPEELVIIAEDRSASPDAVTSSFVEVIKGELPQGQSFSSYCLDYFRYAREWNKPWNTASEDPPHFFAMLWFTCLVAYGYPDPLSGFHDRLKYLILEKHDQLTRLPSVWIALRDWTRNRAAAGACVRELVLPPHDSFRTVIGYSYFLAFPHQHDRQVLAGVLTAANLVGIEPPVSLALEALERSRRGFSKWFREDFDSFLRALQENRRDPRESAFWRAVRQEARTPSVHEAVSGYSSRGEVTIFAEWDDDELLRPYLACTKDWVPPPGFEKHELEFFGGRFSHQVLATNSEDSQAAIAEVFRGSALLSRSPRMAVDQGVLPLANVSSDEFQLASSGSIIGCRLALVREDRVRPFVDTFGGRSADSALRGWFEIEGCSVQEMDELPESLSDVTTLLHTTDSKRPHLVGGLKTPSGAYFRLPRYLPRVRAPDAGRVDVLIEGTRFACTRDPAEDAAAGDWRLPEDLPLEGLNELLVEAEWNVRIRGVEIPWCTQCRSALVDWSLSLGYRGAPVGYFWRETSARSLQPFEGPAIEVPFGITTKDSQYLADLLGFDSSARWLGPGVGEMSLAQRPGFQWLAIGPKKSPDFLIFVGDVTAATPPDGGWSPSGSDRRHWRHAFSRKVPAYVHQDRQYIPVSEVESIKDALKSFRAAQRQRRHVEARRCQPTQLEDLVATENWGVDRIGDEASLLGDVLSIVANSKSGIPLREIHEHVGRLTGTDSRHAVRQHVVRGWTESGAIDLLQRQDGRRTVVVARKPRFVVFRKGPKFFGALVGLLPSSRVGELEHASHRLSLNLSWRRPANGFQLPGASVSSTSQKRIRLLSEQLGYAEVKYLEWPNASKLPDCMKVTGSLIEDQPPAAYQPEARWCTVHHGFRRAPEKTGKVVVERRRHGHRAPIYVVLDGEVPIGWSYSRTWALLSATERAQQAPFELTSDGVLRASGNSPFHLPLPLARLCAVVGVGLPGPELETEGGRVGIRAYAYPFGLQLAQLVEAVVPNSWVRRRNDAGSHRSI